MTSHDERFLQRSERRGREGCMRSRGSIKRFIRTHACCFPLTAQRADTLLHATSQRSGLRSMRACRPALSALHALSSDAQPLVFGARSCSLYECAVMSLDARCETALAYHGRRPATENPLDAQDRARGHGCVLRVRGAA
ncbi:hypothetical protein XAC3624 [Xanthomonas citri pv. citri str. 306]|uniref:Uncharacterized protein n=1 Tax=Xanthomonas axonopodis pv. citri (strain 306) TaxID=190486 RepID=A0AAI7ZHZ8_XANAC|nr:hypothetical protein XAC3624 [Xanthomonas citri pv. citri str. 306]